MRFPKLRTDLMARTMRGVERPYVSVKDPLTQSYFKFEEWEWELMQLFDGTRDETEVAELFDAKRPGMGVDAQLVADYADSFRQSELLERTERERHLAMMDQAKTFRKKRFYDAESSTLFNIEIPLFDPNKLLDRTIHWIRWWWSPWFVVPWLAIFAVVLGYLTYQWDLYWAGFWNLLDPRDKTASHWVNFILMMFFLGIWHELGHAYTCKRYGGEVHNIGITIFYLEPAFYCKVDDSYMFEKRSHRAYTIFGGSYFEMMLCSLAMVLWLWTPVEWMVHGYAQLFVLLSGLSLILLNLNPLIKLDGYYLLMELVDVEDLRENSFEYIGNLIRKHLFRMTVETPPISRRRRRIYLVYGALSILYTAAIMIFIYSWVEAYLVSWFGPAGYLLILLLAAYALRKKIRDGVRFMKHVWLEKRALFSSRRAVTAMTVLILLGVVALTAIRTPTRIDATFTVEPGRRTVVRAPSGATVRRVLVSEGDRVEAGTTLAILEDPELEAERSVAAADLLREEREIARARMAGDAAEEREHASRRAEAREREAILSDKLGRMTLTSPGHGIVSTPYLETMTGRFLAEGETLCVLDDMRRARLAVSTTELEIEEIRPGTPVRILASAFPERTLRATVLEVSPEARESQNAEERELDLVRRANRIRVWMEVDNESGLLRPGMTGHVQFLTTSRSAASKAWRTFHRWASSVFW